jgi:glycosyltransferase involved in cell wall biosynthesis
LDKNTLYITFDGLSDPLGRSQILPYLCGIAGTGFHITVLSCEKKNRLQQENAVIHEMIAGLPISWHHILYDEEGGFLSRLNYIRKIKKNARRICKKKKISLVHCRSYLASLIGLTLKTEFGCAFVFDMRGFWADERRDGNIWKKNNPLHILFYRYFKKKEKEFILRSDSIISLTNAAVTDLSKRFPQGSVTGKTRVIPCCTDTVLFSKSEVRVKPAVPGISPDDHVIIYTGSIGTWYYTKEMIDCVLAWRAAIPNIKLLILTKDTGQLNDLKTTYTVAERSCICSASAGYNEVPAYLSIAKAAMFFIKPAYSKIASSPTKMAECWSMGLPVITNAGIGDNDHYFKTRAGGVLINEFTPAAYAQACLQYGALNQPPQHYRDIALHDFDVRTAIQTYSSVYRSLTG